LTAFVVAAPSVASADGILLPGDGQVRTKSYKVYVGFDGAKQVLIEQVEIIAEARVVGWLRAFPEEPDLVDDLDAPFDILAERTAPQQPHREVMKERLAGPSLVTVVRYRLAENERLAKRDVDDDIEPRRLSVARSVTEVFRGKTFTSTVTRKRHFPPKLERWLETHELDLSGNEEGLLQAYLDRGWVVLGSLVETRSKGGAVRAIVGPTRYLFDSDVAVHPVNLIQAEADPSVRFDYWVAAPEALAPGEYEARWDTQPWKGADPKPNEFIVSYNQPIDDAIETDLIDVAGIDVPVGGNLMSGAFRFKNRPVRDMEFTPAKAPVAIPEEDGRGSSWDLFICILLGIVPLLYAPESWFFLWLGFRAREKADVTQEWTFGLMLWPLFAIGVGVFWALTLKGPARAAALLPALIGIARLATSGPREQPKAVRVKFEKKKD